jgi:hypothetical protein
VSKLGPQRLELDLELLAGARPGLEDVRLYDEHQREVPYLLIPAEAATAEWRESHELQRTVTDSLHSGFEVDLGRLTSVDRVRLVGLQPPLVKRLRLEGSGDRIRYTLLLEDETVFDLPEDGLKRLELDIVPGNHRYLRVLWDDRETRPVHLPELFAVRVTGNRAAPRPTEATIPFDVRASRTDLEQWRIKLPAKHLPIQALRVDSSAPTLMRSARVSESRPTSSGLEAHQLGSTVLRRAQRSGLVAADLRIPIQRPETSELLLTVERGSNPPLPIERLFIEFPPLPWIYFDANRAGTYTAQYGSNQLERPHYDLEAERESVQGRILVQAHWAGPAQSHQVHPATKPGVSPNEALLHGSALAAEPFGFSRTIVDVGGTMASLRLDAAVFAHSRDLSDVRILDPQRRQVPYLLEQESEPWVVALDVKPLSGDARPNEFDARQSVYAISLPYSTLPAGRLSLSTTSRVFRRLLQVQVEQPERPGMPTTTNTLATASWVHADESQEAPALELALPANTAASLYLVVDDGDNVALPISGCRLLLPGHALRFYHVKGEPLTLAYGAPGLSAPSYDLALLTQQLGQLPSAEAQLGEEHPRARAPSKIERQSQWFWGVLIVTALGLIALILRLVRKA